MRPSILAIIILSAAIPAVSAGQRPAPPKPPAAATGDEAKLKSLEAQLAKKPKDAKLKKEVALLHFKVGHAMEYNSSLPPREKYRGALQHYRRALALDPSLTQAAKEKDLIEQIYRGMGRPIPQ